MTDVMKTSDNSVWIEANEHDQMIENLRDAGFFVIEFDGGESAAAFFEEVKDKLPLDPPLSGRVNWNAFSDSLWSGLNDLAAEAVVVVWRGASRLQHADSWSFAVAQDIFAEVASQLNRGMYGAKKKIIRIIFERE